jgi:hypothetical protein
MSPTRLTALALTAATLTASGCGSSKALTSDELVAKADAICKRAQAERASLPTIKTRQDYGTVLSRAGAQQQAAVAELEKLKPPASLAEDWQQIVEVDRTLAGYTIVYGQDIAASNPRAARALLGTATSLQRSIATAAKRDGLNACAEISS